MLTNVTEPAPDVCRAYRFWVGTPVLPGRIPRVHYSYKLDPSTDALRTSFGRFGFSRILTFV